MIASIAIRISKRMGKFVLSLMVGPMLAMTATEGVAEVASTPIAMKFESSSDYPAGAADRGEQGTTIVAIIDNDGTLTAKLLQSSGYDDLDQASLSLAVPYFESGATKGVNLLGVKWSLSGDDTPAPPAGH